MKKPDSVKLLENKFNNTWKHDNKTMGNEVERCLNEIDKSNIKVNSITISAIEPHFTINGYWFTKNKDE